MKQAVFGTGIRRRFHRNAVRCQEVDETVHDAIPEDGTQPSRGSALQVIEVDLAKLFADSESGKLKPADSYQKVCGTIPAELEAGGDMALDANEDYVYFRVGKVEAAKHLPQGTKIEPNFGPRPVPETWLKRKYDSPVK